MVVKVTGAGKSGMVISFCPPDPFWTTETAVAAGREGQFRLSCPEAPQMPHLRGLRGGRAMGSVDVFKDDMLKEKMNMDGRSRMGRKGANRCSNVTVFWLLQTQFLKLLSYLFQRNFEECLLCI